ncbi:MAG: T9SS type A sorting domain-containing protein [Candidatus Aegiribacteria sp.]|nr:T9SS type A sorting domain-containing protein [Candidatus Aegiribacteria sp.]
MPVISPTFLVCPNPFRSSTTIWINQESDTNIEVTIFNTAGRLIRTISPEEDRDDNIYPVAWDGIDENGSLITHGIYFIRSRIGNTCQTVPVVFMR